MAIAGAQPAAHMQPCQLEQPLVHLASSGYAVCHAHQRVPSGAVEMNTGLLSRRPNAVVLSPYLHAQLTANASESPSGHLNGFSTIQLETGSAVPPIPHCCSTSPLTAASRPGWAARWARPRQTLPPCACCEQGCMQHGWVAIHWGHLFSTYCQASINIEPIQAAGVPMGRSSPLRPLT